jgi:5-methylcytosine-specific restriction enzyme subunit McrC
LASSVAVDLGLKRESRRLAATLDEQVSSVRLDQTLLDRLDRQSNRLTVAYEPAIGIIRILFDSQRVTLGAKREQFQLPGFLFDMNRFFQALLSRFLNEHGANWDVQDEAGLKGMIRFSGESRAKWKAPIVRPDFVIRDGAGTVAILDAKYRDLWNHRLPREMLYQLALYAGAHPRRTATILYPTVTPSAQEMQLVVREPVRGQRLSRICLRPVNLRRLNALVMQSPTAASDRERRTYARWLVLGAT